MKIRVFSSLTILLVLLMQSGCSVYKAATQPGPTDISNLGIGSQRVDVITKLGAPKFSDKDEQNKKQDTFEFQSGFHQASKLRILPYLAADVFTLTLAELVLWPMEMTVMESAACIAVVTYDQSQKVESWVLKKKDGVQGC